VNWFIVEEGIAFPEIGFQHDKSDTMSDGVHLVEVELTPKYGIINWLWAKSGVVRRQASI
jgi:hypothetical protein